MKHIKLFEEFINEARKLKIGKEDFSFLLKLTDKELVKKLNSIRKQQPINYKQYMDARSKGQDTSKIEKEAENLQTLEKAVIAARDMINFESANESEVNEAKSKLFAALEKSGKLTQPTGGASMNGKYYQLEGGSKYDVIHFDYDPKSNKPFGVAQVAGHHMPIQILNKLGFRETRSWTAGVEVYIFDGNYNPKSMTEDEMSELVDGWSKGFGSYAKSISDFYKKRGKTSGTID